ncbi:uncharacterized protein LOC129316445 [Prosopis cineraria]|uniref:uncharacterized protein LOC129316445 n=1 Tax=Prosopis cineraria TaxID=364024 RepID=UPI00240F36CA|nr:uncharacterized protein LOC129316445 [Prosopis cineraria]
MVADALSWKTLHMASLIVKEYRLMESFMVSQQDAPLKALVGAYSTKINNDFRKELRMAQLEDESLLKIKEEIEADQTIEICVPEDVDLRKVIFNEAHCSKYIIHSGATKMYQDVKRYW